MLVEPSPYNLTCGDFRGMLEGVLEFLLMMSMYTPNIATTIPPLSISIEPLHRKYR